METNEGERKGAALLCRTVPDPINHDDGLEMRRWRCGSGLGRADGRAGCRVGGRSEGDALGAVVFVWGGDGIWDGG